MHMKVSIETHQFFFTTIYGSPIPSVRIYQWRQIKQISSSITGSWLLAGDFKSKKGGRPLTSTAIKDFGQCVDDCNLVKLESRALHLPRNGRGFLKTLTGPLLMRSGNLCFLSL